ncbi:glycosyltransferase [Actinokineospora iranica]|uniref:Galactofuranosylgalactofuranosylrhamnosyl-N-acetylglucosaminyl-diphospho-decaprenol beta-1,5/1,6-galactofuranosyltransferase n=1 Tax=Actinokineospora iranica TaxID=1271860 RepID=A0A1G6P6D5_9PSEU|nr:glycosyltransferase [Actinokineospora iranica]SDC75568.1 galactofuranosylgalactofuranosylrhamnosyl-N-acetylglucosaminyl-diphospho-decaprenol beta-1,5/1,6-galactofuranosyltransferase [Actinokineospora iranica]
MPSSTSSRSGSAETESAGERANAAAQPDDSLVGHASTGRLVAQRGLFGGPAVIPQELYAGIGHGSATRGRERLVVNPNSAVTTDTYFGRFPASYWQRWTVVDEVVVELAATGSGKIALVASDLEGETRVVVARTVRDAENETVRLTAKLNMFLDGGFLWVEFTTEETPLTVERMRWTVDAPEVIRPTAVVICTFNRADDCVATLGALAGDPAALDVVDAVYVVDQGTDTVSSRAAFPDAEKALDGRLRYLRQPNLGGAGGFGRGMYEVTEVSHADQANVLLMDDDVLLDPEIAIRLTAFANRTAKPTIVGGQMLRLLHPTKLLAGAEYADFAQLVPGKVVKGGLDDVDLLAEAEDDNGKPTGKPNRGDLRVDAHYNAWWSCLIPSEVVNRLGYPLPLFFQWDDVEYGYRARAQGIATVTLPGAGLWHADFDWKDADKWNEYFAVRNAMVVSALHSETDPKRIARVLLSRVVRYLLSMQYGLALTVIKAAEDFLKGPAIFADGGAAAAAEIRKLRAEYPDTIMHSPAEVGQVPMVKAGPTPSWNRLVLLKRLVYLAMGKTVHDIAAVPAGDAAWWHVSQFDKVVVTDASQEGVRIRKRDREQVVTLAKRAAAVARLLVSETPRLRGEYRAAVPEVTSKDNWKRLYDL